MGVVRVAIKGATRAGESGVTVRIERIEGSRGPEQVVVTTASTDVEGSRVMRNRNDAPPE